MDTDSNWREDLPEDTGDPGDAAIEALLDVAYEQLDGFVAWLEQKRGVNTRTAQQDCFNAEALLDYLANHQRKSADAINEYELRWFLFSHYIRKAQAEAETEERLPLSLQNFFQFLQAEHGYTWPNWLRDGLDDHAFYLKRRRDYAALDSEDERAWEVGFQTWCAELEDDLDTRALLLPRELGDGMLWGEVMGWREATLWGEANDLWQAERAELLDSGLDFDRIRNPLYEVYRRWVDTPQDRLDGQTPAEVILDERQERDEAAEE